MSNDTTIEMEIRCSKCFDFHRKCDTHSSRHIPIHTLGITNEFRNDFKTIANDTMDCMLHIRHQTSPNIIRVTTEPAIRKPFAI